MAAEEVGAFLCVGNALDAAIRGLIGLDKDGFDTFLRQDFDNGLTTANAKVFGEETTIAHNDA